MAAIACHRNDSERGQSMATGEVKVGDAQLQGSPARYILGGGEPEASCRQVAASIGRLRGPSCVAVCVAPPPACSGPWGMHLRGPQGPAEACSGGQAGGGDRVHTRGVALRMDGCGKAYR